MTNHRTRQAIPIIRDAVDPLAERRSLVLESMREGDIIARKLYEYQISEIDRELAKRDGGR